MDPRRQNACSHTAVGVYQIFQEALRRGLSAGELFALTGLRPDDVSDFGRRIPAGTLFDVWEAVMRRLRDPGFPVRAARRAQRDPRSAVSLLAQVSGTVGEAFDQAVRYGTAWSTVYSLRTQPWWNGGIIVTLDGLGVDRLGERCEAEYTLAEIVSMLRSYPAVAPAAVPVRFAHPAPARTVDHRRHFGRTLRFGAPRTELVVAASTLGLPLRTAHPGLAAILAARLDDLAVPGRRPGAFSLEVRRLLLERLGNRPVGAPAIARALMVSERTLQRRLAAEGLTLRGLLDEVRRTSVTEMLDSGGYSIREIASALGFADVRSLHRAYRRWTGTTPRGRRPVS